MTSPSTADDRYDVDGVAAAARQKDPGLSIELAGRLAEQAGRHLRELGRPDAPEIARRLLADHPEHGATPAAIVAVAAVESRDRQGPFTADG